MLESWFPDFQTPPPPKKLSDPNLTPLPTHPGIKYVARALAAVKPLIKSARIGWASTSTGLLFEVAWPAFLPVEISVVVGQRS